MMKSLVVGLMAVGFAAFTTTAALADSDYEYGKQMSKLVQEMPKAKVPLAQGIKDAEQGGNAISAQYEVDEDAGYQLSVFVAKGASINEVIVDYATGKIKSSDELTDPDDIKDAKNQREALQTAKKSLADAVDEAVKANPGFVAIRVVPKRSGGTATAEVTLLQGSKTKKVSEQL